MIILNSGLNFYEIVVEIQKLLMTGFFHIQLKIFLQESTISQSFSAN